jgi:hypothetical protein
VNPTTEGDARHIFGQGRPMAKDASGSGANWYQGTLSAAQNANQNVVESRLFFTGTTGMSGGLDLSRSTDAREKGRLGLFGTAESYAGAYPRVTSESIGRDLNPLGRGDGFGYVAGALLVARLAPWLPKHIALSGTGNSVNNPTPGGDGWPTLNGGSIECGCCKDGVHSILLSPLGMCPCDGYLIAHALMGCCTSWQPAGLEADCRNWRCQWIRCIDATHDPWICGLLNDPVEKVLSDCECDKQGGGSGGGSGAGGGAKGGGSTGWGGAYPSHPPGGGDWTARSSVCDMNTRSGLARAGRFLEDCIKYICDEDYRKCLRAGLKALLGGDPSGNLSTYRRYIRYCNDENTVFPGDPGELPPPNNSCALCKARVPRPNCAVTINMKTYLCCNNIWKPRCKFGHNMSPSCDFLHVLLHEAVHLGGGKLNIAKCYKTQEFDTYDEDTAEFWNFIECVCSGGYYPRPSGFQW